MPRRIPDIAKVNRLVGFKPEMSLDGILKSVIEYHSGQNSREYRTTTAEA